jgi:hypothetical protein
VAVLTDFVVAKREQAEQVARSPQSFADGVFGKGIDTDTLAALHGILSSEPHDTHFMRDALLLQESSQGRSVLEVPAKLVRPLAALGPKQLADVASEWAAREEMEFDYWSVEEVRDILTALAGLCQHAEAKGEPLLMWIKVL